MKCSQCGAPLEFVVEKCPNCGKVLTDEERLFLALHKQDVTHEAVPQQEPEVQPEHKHKSKKHSHTIIMIEGALCIALAFVFSKINLFQMPQGGSIDFELVPLILFAYRRGFKWGVLTGALMGFIKILLGAYFFNVAQVILDYPLAYAFVGFCAAHPAIIGLILAAVGQTGCSILSGVLFFAEYAPEGQSPLVYSFLYNAPVLGTKYLVSWIVAMILWKVLERELPVQD